VFHNFDVAVFVKKPQNLMAQHSVFNAVWPVVWCIAANISLPRTALSFSDLSLGINNLNH
jgi:hypothetical protein